VTGGDPWRAMGSGGFSMISRGNSWKNMGKSWKNMGKSWKNVGKYGKIMGKIPNSWRLTSYKCIVSKIIELNGA
jgi:hypothetical protein